MTEPQASGGYFCYGKDLCLVRASSVEIASHCGSSNVDENREPQAKTEPAVGTGEEEKVPE